MKIARRLLLNTPMNCALTVVLLLVGACGGPAAPQPPAAASNVTSEAGPGYVTVSWQDNSDNETGFEVYRESVGGVTSQQAGTKIATVDANESSFVDMDIEIEQEYDYSVVAVNEVGSSDAAAAAAAANVPIGVDMIVGTNNRRWTEESNGTIFVVYFVFPDSMIEDQTDVFDVAITGPPGWNGDTAINYSCAWNECSRAKGFSIISESGITALGGAYSVTVSAGGQQYVASANLSAPGFKFPRPTEITVTDASASGATVNWTAPPGTESHVVFLHHGEYEGLIDGWIIGPETTYTVDEQTLAEGIYGMEVVAFNSDIFNYPLKVEPFGLSYDIELFGVGDVYSTECTSADEAIDIPDAALQQVVRDELGIPSGDINCLDMALLTAISAEDAGIASLEGLQYAANLEDVFLHGNDVTDVSPLAGLTKLWHLNLNLNEVTNVGPLENLTNLLELELCCSTGNITDVTPLEGLTQLWSLNLTGHALGDSIVWPLLENYPNLLRLRVGENDLTDFSALADHPNLEELQVSGNTIPDMTPIAALTNLTELQLHWANITDLTPLHSMTQLSRLDARGLGLTDISFLEDFDSLDFLTLWDNQITSLAPLVANVGIGAGDYVDVGNNALDLNDSGVQADIQTLLDRGVDLHYE